jgi:hypothetical protein
LRFPRLREDDHHHAPFGAAARPVFAAPHPGKGYGMSKLIVVRDEVDGWDVIREEDPQALTNTATKEDAVAAAEAILADEGGEGEVVVHGDEVHPLDDTSRGLKTYVVALLGLLAAVTVIIVITSLLASWTLS